MGLSKKQLESNPIAGMGAASAKAAARARAKYGTTLGGPAYTPTPIIPHSEAQPTPANIPSTGTEHLSGVQFPQVAGLTPAAGAGLAQKLPSRLASAGSGVRAGIASTNTTSMYPGSARSFTPRFSMHPGGMSSRGNSSGYLPGSGNLVGSGNFAGGTSKPATGNSSPKKRGNPSAAVVKAASGKGKMRTAVRQKAASGKASLLGMIKPSKHAGKNAENLKKATNA